MAVIEICVWKRLIIAIFFFVVDGERSEWFRGDSPRFGSFGFHNSRPDRVNVDGPDSGPSEWFHGDASRFGPFGFRNPRPDRVNVDGPDSWPSEWFGGDIPSFGPFGFHNPRPGRINIDGPDLRPFFMVMFPSVIESGSDVKLCASLLKPNESLTMTVSLLDEKNMTTQLVRQTSRMEFHRCFNFQAPRVTGDSVQRLRVVVQGRSFKMTEERKVMFRSYLPLTFIQTDKPLYNPGQTVNFRVVTMDAKFVPLEQMYSLVVFEDIHNIRIRQWTNVSSTGWILELSHNLHPEAQVGMYTLKAFIGDRMISQDFEVKKYALPKFDVSVNAPQTCSVGDVELEVEVCGKYTYGQPVPGEVFVEVCRDPFPFVVAPEVNRLCLSKSAEVNGTGCVSLAFSTSVFFSSTFEQNLQDSFLVNVNVTEEGTDVVMSKSSTVIITFEVGKVTFVDLQEFFDSGSTLNGKILASTFNGTPIANMAVYLLDGSQWPNKQLLDLTTDQNGLATFSLNTASFPKENLNLVASGTPEVAYGYKSPYFRTDTRVVKLLQSATPDNPTFSELTIVTLEQPLKCGTTYPVTIKYSFVGETGDYSVDIIYMVLSRGVIVLHGFETIQGQASDVVTSGTVSFDLSVSLNMAPVVQILALSVLPSANVVAGSVSFDIERCFQNQVSLQFSPDTALPGEDNILTVSAQAGSLCGLSAVDQSVLIMESGGRLTAEVVFNLLPVQSLLNYPAGVEDDQECLNVRTRRAVPTDTTNEAFKSVGMKIATNLYIREPQCLTYRGLKYYRNLNDVMYPETLAKAPAVEEGGPGDKSTSTFDVTIRSYFPETWIWKLVPVGDSGSTQVPLTVPDTISTWEAEAFCLSSKGFGLAPPVLLKTFQPFFLEVSLPYSIVRGEFFELKATVFNYLSECITIHVTPARSSAFVLKPLQDRFPSCLCGNGRKTFKWVFMSFGLGKVNVTIRAQAVQSNFACGGEPVSVPEKGRIDVVTQSLLVLAEGVGRTNTQNWLLCPKGGTVSETVNLMLPTGVIQGSARCTVSVLGDIMGRALKNLDGLLRLPSDCGEQNMIVLAPNIYIMQYLEVTGQLTSAIRKTAVDYLQRGYQGQLNYRHNDGSYSTFGYDASNTWLTAFVLRSFGLARNFIFIDSDILQSAKDWLISKQDSDGCFMQEGTLYHSDMMGGVEDSVAVTAYITASLLELDVPVTDHVVTSALSCLSSAIENLGNTYVTALLAYTFSLAGDTNTRSQLLNDLNNTAIFEGAKVHWSQTSSDDTLAVEISSYVLLAYVVAQPLSTANLSYANRIVNWLVAQQNPFGGFTSTQDTVVALHALALYAAKVYSPEGSSTVTLKSLVAGWDVYSFDVNRDNRLLYQEKPLKSIPGRYSVNVKGSACVSMQVACFYNIPKPVALAKTLSVEAKVTGDCQTTGDHLMLNFTVKYVGEKPSTNMVIVDIKLLSGFTADTSMLGDPPNEYAPLVERVDADDDHVLVYLKEVAQDVPMTYTIQLNQVLPVHNLKPVIIHVYDYYQTNDWFETTYTSPC